MLNEYINTNLINLNLAAETKDEVFSELAIMLVKNGNVNNLELFLADLRSREAVSNTGFEEGIAFPHAKSTAVTKPGFALGISRSGIDYGSEDGQPAKLFFMIASPEGSTDHHVTLLAKISNKLLESGFMEKLQAATTKEQALELLLGDNSIAPAAQTTATKGFLIGVTGCPTGIAHTYLAAETLEQTARKLGYEIKVETNGSVGAKNSPTEEEIARADAIIVSSDKQVDLERFAGKKLIHTGVKAAIKDSESLINQALAAAPYRGSGTKTNNSSKPDKNSGRPALYVYLMNGVSFMIPFVVTGGLLIALSLAIGGKPTAQGLQIPTGSDWNTLLNIGVVSFKLMIPVLAGYIAYAIGDRAALAPGFIGGWIANDGSFYHATAGTGFIGAIIAGLLVGYFVRYIANLNYNKMLRPLVPIFIAPISGTLFIAAVFVYIIGAPIASLMIYMTHVLQEMSTGNYILLGIVLGGMTGFDMGGPFNKVAFLFSIGMIASGQTQFMGAMACAIPVAPLGMCLATLLGAKMNLFSEQEMEAGKAAGAMGLVGISEGAIPFAANDPVAVIPANMIGSMVAAVLAFSFSVTDSVAHGGPVVALLGAMNKPLLALLCMLCGAFVTAIVVLTIKKFMRARQK